MSPRAAILGREGPRQDSTSTYDEEQHVVITADADPGGEFTAVSTRDVFILAEAVARPGVDAGLIAPDNSSAGRCSLEEAAKRRLSFFVRVRDDILAFEFDRVEYLSVLTSVAAVLEDKGVKCVIVASGREDHRHLFARVGDPRLRTEVRSLVVALTGSRTANRRDIRPPLAPHRLGRAVRLIEPATVAEAVRRLESQGGTSASGRIPAVGSETPDGQGRLSTRIYRLMVHGDLERRYDHLRSGVIQAVLTGMINAGWSEQRAFAFLKNPRNKGGAKIHEIEATKGDRAAYKYFSRSWSRAQEFVREHPAIQGRPEAVAELVRLRERVQESEWTGSKSLKARSVLMGVLDLAVERGSFEVQASVRQLAEASGLSRDSVMSTYLPFLLNQGWIKKVGTGRGIGSNTYKVMADALSLLPLSTRPPGCETSGGELSISHDAFRSSGGLNKNGYEVLTCLVESGTVDEIHQLTGVPLSTCHKVLGAMAKTGVVNKTNSVWTRPQSMEVLLGALDRYALASGVAESSTRQRQRHQQERVAWDAYRSREAATPTSRERQPGWYALKGRGFWPIGQPVAGIPTGDGYIGLMTLSFTHSGNQRFLLASATRDRVEVEIG